MVEEGTPHPALGPQLNLERCPHCLVDRPTFHNRGGYETDSLVGHGHRFWMPYSCSRCGGVVTAASRTQAGAVVEMYPAPTEVDPAVPSPAREYLKQAMDSGQAPAGMVMLAASAVDAMLKNKGYAKGTLYERIDQAAENHLITEEMARWAHQVRLDANEPRHADEERPLPEPADAKRSADFALALAQYLFVLPSLVTRGISNTAQEEGGGEESSK